MTILLFKEKIKWYVTLHDIYVYQNSTQEYHEMAYIEYIFWNIALMLEIQ